MQSLLMPEGRTRHFVVLRCYPRRQRNPTTPPAPRSSGAVGFRGRQEEMHFEVFRAEPSGYGVPPSGGRAEPSGQGVPPSTKHAILKTAMETVTYTIILSPADEGGFTVTVPALPAVVTEGDSYEQAIEMAREAIGLYLESLAVRGEAILAGLSRLGR